jgi:hypothetical protein
MKFFKVHIILTKVVDIHIPNAWVQKIPKSIFRNLMKSDLEVFSTISNNLSLFSLNFSLLFVDLMMHKHSVTILKGFIITKYVMKRNITRVT